MTPDEAFRALKDYIAYFGTYSIDEAGRHGDASPSGDHSAGRFRRLRPSG